MAVKRLIGVELFPFLCDPFINFQIYLLQLALTEGANLILQSFLAQIIQECLLYVLVCSLVCSLKVGDVAIVLVISKLFI